MTWQLIKPKTAISYSNNHKFMPVFMLYLNLSCIKVSLHKMKFSICISFSLLLAVSAFELTKALKSAFKSC